MRLLFHVMVVAFALTGCGGDADKFKSLVDEATVTPTGIILSGSIDKVGTQVLATGASKTIVTVGTSSTLLTGDRGTVDETTKKWTYTYVFTEAEHNASTPKTFQIRYWVNNHLVDTDQVTVKIP